MNQLVYQSSIPSETKEKFISAYISQQHCNGNGCGGAVWLEKREYWLQGKVVGIRYFEEDGTLAIETPLKDDKYHGTYYRFYETGTLEYALPYLHGKQHGQSCQWTPGGLLMGTSSFSHGTGYDLWWHPFMELDKPGFYLAEILPYKDGVPHGVEWWLNEDQQSVYIERYYREGNLHGIERWWDVDGHLREDYPNFYIHNNIVSQEEYISATHNDPTLPKFVENDQLPQRTFPDVIAEKFG